MLMKRVFATVVPRIDTKVILSELLCWGLSSQDNPHLVTENYILFEVLRGMDQYVWKKPNTW